MYPKRSYSERLKDPRWAEFRQRCWDHHLDSYTETVRCGFCFAEQAEKAHLHHKFYVAGREPWDYEIDDMMFLCGACHTWLHEDALEVWTYMLSGNDYMNQQVLEVVKMLKTLPRHEQHTMWSRFNLEVEHWKTCESKYERGGARSLHEIMMENPLRHCCRHRLGLPELHFITRLKAA